MALSSPPEHDSFPWIIGRSGVDVHLDVESVVIDLANEFCISWKSKGSCTWFGGCSFSLQEYWSTVSISVRWVFKLFVSDSCAAEFLVRIDFAYWLCDSAIHVCHIWYFRLFTWVIGLAVMAVSVPTWIFIPQFVSFVIFVVAQWDFCLFTGASGLSEWSNWLLDQLMRLSRDRDYIRNLALFVISAETYHLDGLMGFLLGSFVLLVFCWCLASLGCLSVLVFAFQDLMYMYMMLLGFLFE